MLELIKSEPGITLKRMKEALGLDCSIQSIHQALQRMGIMFKKTLRASEQDREEMAQAREQWKQEQPEWKAGRLIFVDETGVKTTMTRP